MTVGITEKAHFKVKTPDKILKNRCFLNKKLHFLKFQQVVQKIKIASVNQKRKDFQLCLRKIIHSLARE